MTGSDIVGVFFLDFSKPFHLVSHEELLWKNKYVHPDLCSSHMYVICLKSSSFLHVFTGCLESRLGSQDSTFFHLHEWFSLCTTSYRGGSLCRLLRHGCWSIRFENLKNKLNDDLGTEKLPSLLPSEMIRQYVALENSQFPISRTSRFDP